MGLLLSVARLLWRKTHFLKQQPTGDLLTQTFIAHLEENIFCTEQSMLIIATYGI